MHYVTEVINKSDSANLWMESQYNLSWLPTSYLDGGYSLLVGSGDEATFRSHIDSAGRREVMPLGLRLTVTWLGYAAIAIDITLKHYSCVDFDGDGFGDPGYPESLCPVDNCPSVYNPLQSDSDNDGTGDLCDYLCGDGDGSESVDIDDAVYLINYIFAGGPPPDPMAAGDVDCSGDVDIDDVVYLIGFIFGGGFEPCDPDGNGVPDC